MDKTNYAKQVVDDQVSRAMEHLRQADGRAGEWVASINIYMNSLRGFLLLEKAPHRSLVLIVIVFMVLVVGFGRRVGLGNFEIWTAGLGLLILVAAAVIGAYRNAGLIRTIAESRLYSELLAQSSREDS